MRSASTILKPMKLQSKGLPALFLVCLLAITPSVSVFAANETANGSSTISNVVNNVWEGAANTWSWGRSFGNTLALLGSDKIENLKVPVLGVAVSQLSDTWGDARSNGRTHEGIDIMAPRGTPVISPTKAVVSEIGYGALGGNYVYTINPDGERFYFAHLDGYAEGLVKGKVLEAGDVIGYVGNTGNASGGATHLHFGIYSGGASNPYPRLTVNWTTDELAAIKAKIGGAVSAVMTTPTTQPVSSTKTIATSAAPYSLSSLTRDLTLGSTGQDVKILQQFLNTHGAVIATTGAGSPGNETSYFGQATRAALAKYQTMKNISPAVGYFGPLTRTIVAKDYSSTLAVK